MIEVILSNGRKFYACEDVTWFNNQVIVDRSKYDIDYNYVTFTVWNLKKKLPFMKYRLGSLDIEVINQNYIISVRDVGNDNEWFEKYVSK